MNSDAIAQIAHDTTPVNARRVNMVVALLAGMPNRPKFIEAASLRGRDRVSKMRDLASTLTGH